VSKGLREIPEVLTRCRVDLFRIKLKRPGERQQLLAQGVRALGLADHREGGHEPEGADGKRALLARESRVRPPDPVAQDQAVLRQVVGDRQHGRPDPLVVRRKEPHDRQEQERGIEVVGFVMLPEDAFLGNALVQHLRRDLFGACPPPLGPFVIAAFLGEVGTPRRRDPAHHLGGREMLRVTADFPDPLVRFAPV
jgi:hypothetical protein